MAGALLTSSTRVEVEADSLGRGTPSCGQRGGGGQSSGTAELASGSVAEQW